MKTHNTPSLWDTFHRPGSKQISVAPAPHDGATNTSRQATLWPEKRREEPFDTYFDDVKFTSHYSGVTANHHKNNPQSVAANKKARHSAGKAKQTILARLSNVYEASCETLETLTGLSHQTCSARLSELKRDGRIVKSGTTKTRSGCTCALYRVST